MRETKYAKIFETTFKKVMVMSVALVLVIGMVPIGVIADGADVVPISAPVFSDMPNDWSTKALENAVKNGLLNGANGKIMPKDNLTRAEMATVINRAFGTSVEASIEGFIDVPTISWYYNEMKKAVQMGTFKGSENKLNPKDSISREQAFLVISRAFKLGQSAVVPTGFSDLGDIASWAKGEVYALINAGYIQGSDGKINPKGTMTRAEFAQMMDNILKVYINEAGVYETVAEGNLMVNVPGVTLKNLTVKGDLIIGDGVGDGDFTLDNVIVEGRTVVRGGGENSIVIKNGSKLGKIIITRVDGVVRVVTEDGSTVEAVFVDDGKDGVIIEGEVDSIDVQTGDVEIILKNAKVKTVTVSSPNANVSVGAGSNVGNLVVNAPNTTVSGEGNVENADVNAGANNSKIATPNTTIKVGEGVSGTTGSGGGEIAEGKTFKNDADTTKAPVEQGTPPAGGGGGTPAVVPMAINSTLPGFTVGVPATFTVSTVANNDIGKMVKAHFTIPDGVTVEYQEGGQGEWIPLVDVFGPETGFPLGDIKSTFRGTFTEAGSKTVKVEFKEVSTGTILGSKVITATVEEAPVVKVADVANIADLTTAIANTDIKTINITADISDITEALVVNHAVTINGGDKTLSFTAALNTKLNGERQGILVNATGTTINNLTVVMAGAANWQGVYGIQVYNATGVTLNNVTASGADGGILVNGSAVELTGVTTVSRNEFGGIEVSKGEGLTNSALTVTGTLVNTSEAYEQPTIWLVNDQGTLTGVESLTTNTTIKDDQTQYYMTADNALSEEQKAAKNAVKPSWTLGDIEVVTNETTLPENVSDVEYKVSLTTAYTDDLDETAKARTVTTFITVPDGVTIYYPSWSAEGALTWKVGNPGETVAYGMVGHPLSADNVAGTGVVYAKTELAEGTELEFTIKLVDAADGWENVVYGESTLTGTIPDTTAPVLGNVNFTMDNDGNLVLTVNATDNVGLATLEVDHSLGAPGDGTSGTLPEFTVGTEDVEASEATMGASFTFANDTWTLSFGPTVSAAIRSNEDEMTFYFVITDVAGNQFGDMSPPTAENTKIFEVPAAPDK